jgi:hypothetical protein
MMRVNEQGRKLLLVMVVMHSVLCILAFRYWDWRCGG